MVRAGEKVVSYPFDGYWMDLGRVTDYEQAVQDFEQMKPQILGDYDQGENIPQAVASIIENL
jgi:NDP-sugar pyrophosphorylase family protein